MIAVDTSVVVAGFASWHEGHRAATAVLDRRPRVPGHVLIETCSVLTRLPLPHRAPAQLVSRFLAERFVDAPLTLPPRAHLALLEKAAREGIVGGSIYDALIAEVVRRAGATLLTRDRRAVLVYERIGADYEIIG